MYSVLKLGFSYSGTGKRISMESRQEVARQEAALRQEATARQEQAQRESENVLKEKEAVLKERDARIQVRHTALRDWSKFFSSIVCERYSFVLGFSADVGEDTRKRKGVITQREGIASTGPKNFYGPDSESSLSTDDTKPYLRFHAKWV